MKMQIPADVIEKALEGYKQEAKYLVGASVEYPKAEGIFRLGKTCYADENTNIDHFTAVESQICLNQLCYSAFGYWIKTGELEALPVTFDEFMEMRKGSMFVTEAHTKFKRVISTGRNIQGRFKIEKSKKFGELYIAHLTFDFEDRSAYGKLEVAVKSHKPEFSIETNSVR